MKTQIISLDSHDDLVSVRDKLAWAKTPRILLVWPPRGRVGLRPLDLRLLQRHAASLGAQLGLVTRSEEMIQSAREIGIPVFRTAAEAQRSPWPAPRQRFVPSSRPRHANLRLLREQVRLSEAAWRRKPLARLFFFALGVMAALIVAALFVPGAEVTLPMSSQIQSVELPLAAGAQVTSASLSGMLPTDTVSLTLEGSESMPASGVIALPQTKARGVVTFRNLTPNAIQLPAGTIVQTLDPTPVRFQTTRAGEIPSGIDGKLDLPVEALLPGKSSNVAAGAIRAVVGNLGPSLAVSNAQALEGGGDLSTRGPSSFDRWRARDLLLASLERQALSALEEMADGLLLPNTLTEEVAEETYLPPPGQPGDRLTVSMRVEFRAEFIRRSDLEYLGNTVLDADLQDGQASLPGSLRWEALSEPVSAQDGLTRLRVRLSRRVWRRISPIQVVQLVQGQKPALAEQRLQSRFAFTTRPQIRLWPSWWPWLPITPTRIQVAFEFP